MKKEKIRIMVAPIQGVAEKVELNQNRIFECCKQAALQNIDVICFPELILNGAETQLMGMKIYEYAQPLEGRLHQWLEQLAKSVGIYIAAGMIQKSRVPGRLYSTYLICGPNGKTKNIYQKRYFDGMDQLYMTGSTIKDTVIDSYSFGNIAYALDADIDTAEYVQELINKKPDLILAASYGRMRDVKKLAERCKSYVVYTGNGYGYIYDPSGRLLAGKESAEVFTYEIML